MRHTWLICGLILAGLLLGGCTTTDQDSTDDFLLVNEYVEEIIPAIGDTMLDLTGWVRDPLDDERILWLDEGKKELLSLQKKHLRSRFPSFESMERWTVPVVKGEEKWEIEGPVLAPAVQEFTEAVDQLIDTLTIIIDAEGKMSKGEKENVERVMQLVDEAVYEIKEIFGMG